MTIVTVFRKVPRPIIGTVGVIHDRSFEAFEERLDWLETTGLLVERFDPKTAPAEVEARQTVRRLLSAEGGRCLPLILVNDAPVSKGVYLSRTELARAVGRALRGITLDDREQKGADSDPRAPAATGSPRS